LKEGQHGWVGAQLIRIPGAPGHIDGIVVFDCGLFDARINWNPAGILSELDGQNMRLSYLGELDAECRRIFYVVGRDEMADGAPRLEAFIASLLLTGAEAVGSPLAAAYEKLLKEVSVGDR